MVRSENDSHIDFSLHSAFNKATGKPVSRSHPRSAPCRGPLRHPPPFAPVVSQGRLARKKAKSGTGSAE